MIYILTNSSDIHLLQTIYNVIKLVIITLHADGIKTMEQKNSPTLKTKEITMPTEIIPIKRNYRL